ncbi:MAG: MmgE/PrpD family protein [Pseudomonadota bacterium]
MAIALTRALGKFVSEIRYDQLPADAIAVAKLGFTDCIAVMVAGSDELVVKIARDVLVAKASAPEARLVPSGERVSGADAALVNGTAGHAFDFDDVALDGHPSAVLVPAILAEAEALGASGRDMITAYVAGYETWGELLARETDHLHTKGWHPTCIFGAVGAAAACAVLRKLDAERAATALAIAASEASGVAANFGTMMKPLQVGRAAQSGALAARLAAAGMTASLDALEHANGYLAAFAPQGRIDVDSDTKQLGVTWRIVTERLNVKQYPMCYLTHRVLDGVVDLAKQHDIDPKNVERVDVSIGVLQIDLLRNHRPQTGLEAKFSLEFAVASGLTARSAGLSELTDKFVGRADIQGLMGKVHYKTVAETLPGLPWAPFDQVTVTMAGGKVVQSPPVRYARGSVEAPLAGAELRRKFDDCVGGKLSAAEGAALFAALDGLERLASAGDLKLRGATAPSRAAS